MKTKDCPKCGGNIVKYYTGNSYAHRCEICDYLHTRTFE